MSTINVYVNLQVNGVRNIVTAAYDIYLGYGYVHVRVSQHDKQETR